VVKLKTLSKTVHRKRCEALAFSKAYSNHWEKCSGHTKGCLLHTLHAFCQVHNQVIFGSYSSVYLACQVRSAMPSASVQTGSTGNGGAWLKELQWKLQQISDIQPITLPNPPQLSILVCGLVCWGCQLYEVLCHVSGSGTNSCNRECGRFTHQLSEQAHDPGQA
jgi:hypothetical protein